MVLKTYTAPDLASALALARSELGPDALVLATREVAGRFGLEAVEVTVGVSRPAPAAAFAPGSPGHAPITSPKRPAARRRLSAYEGEPEPREAAAPPSLAPALDALVDAGLSRDLALRFAKIASRSLPRRASARKIAEAAERGIAGIVEFAPLPIRSRCLFVVGPPGAGKTTTVAKLVARLALSRDRRVVFAEADADRIGSLEQAEIFCRHIGATPLALAAPSDLAGALAAAGPRGSVVVDTPGVGARDRDRLAFLRELRAAAPSAEVAILVPAGLHRDEAARVLERFAVLRPSCAAFSRVDDGGRPGELVTALASARLPLSFVTTGHEVPGDLESASARGLAAMLLRAGTPPCRATETNA